MLPLYAPGGPTPDADRAVLLSELVGLAAAAAKGKGGDGIAHWIREGVARWKRYPQPPPQEEERQGVPISLETLFG